MSVNIPGLVSVIIFYVVILATGIWASRKSKREEKKCTGNKSEVTMVGGRNLNVCVSIFTMTATWVGGGFILGTAEIVYLPSQGLAWSVGLVGYSLSLIVGGIFFTKPVRGKNYITIMDPFQLKYGNKLTSILFIPALLADIFWVACVLAALGGTMSVILDISSYYSVIISAGVAILYTLLGGLYSVAYTDVIQLIFMLFSLWLCVPFTLLSPASTDIAYTAVNELYQSPWIGKIEPTELGRWLDDVLLVVMSDRQMNHPFQTLGGICYQAFYQRILAVASTTQAQVTCYVGSIFCFVLGIPSVIIGAVAASTDWNQTSYGLPTPYEREQAGMILPITLQHLCPSYISIAGIGAIAAAVMSSIDSALLSSASLFARNIYKNILRKKASENEIMWVVKFSVLLFGSIGMSLAMTTNSVFVFWLLSGDMMYTVVCAQVLCVLFVPKSNGYGACVGFVLGLTLRCLAGEPIMNIAPVIHFPGCRLVDGVYVQYFPFKTVSMLISFFSIVIVSHLASFLFNKGLLKEKWDIFNVKEKSSITLKDVALNELTEESILHNCQHSPIICKECSA
ncbi:high affinity choline transporter 1-like isoform X2 [Lepisosteus oculatus]|uniref:high affinity choline transporter 1-like isoform X2 n=1 Tax=Lepisosteus oculatus TaxID=7918 RepID=UPI0007401100|nr:PREDICTED: high affinity choline transporter 1-like isoform X2 [Lepisosteus oculatus]